MTDLPGLPHGFHAERDAYIARTMNINNYGNYQDLDSAIWDTTEYFRELDLDRFTGRDDLIGKIDKFIAGNRHGWVVIQGEAGVGKSALAAYLVKRNHWFHHFTKFTGAQSPERARKNLAAQLIREFGLKGHAPVGQLPPDAGQPKYLADLLRDAAAKRDGDKQAAGRPIVLVIDTLSEMHSVGESDTPLGLPVADQLPYKVFIIVTRRPAQPLHSVLEPRLQVTIKLDAPPGPGDGARPISTNSQDMKKYLMKLLSGDDMDPALADRLNGHDIATSEFIDPLVARCAGIWIYLKYVLDDIRAGKWSPANVRSLPQGLRAYYLREIQAQQQRHSDKWERLYLPALATLAALRRPATAQKLADLAGIHDTADIRELLAWLDGDMRALLCKALPESREGNDYRYEIRHQSLRELVAAPGQPGAPSDEANAADADDVDLDDVDVDDDLSRALPNALRAAHAAITADLMPDGRNWSNADQYVRDMLAEHAANAGLLDGLVADPGFLLICRPLSVLLRRRSLRTPAAIHAVSAYEAALSEWAKLPPDDESERAWRLHVWARKTCADQLAGACLEIARRTPAIQAAMWTGSVHRVMHAHDGSAGTVTVLPVSDGRPLLASGGSDGRVRLWDPDTGEAQADLLRESDAGDPLPGHDDLVTVALPLPLPDQQVLLATGGRDGVVRLWNPQTRELFCDPVVSGAPVDAMAVVRLADDRAALAVGGRDGMRIWSWDPEAKALRGVPLAGCANRVTAAAAVPARSGQLLATGDSNGLVQLWNPQTREAVVGPLTDHNGPVNAITAVRVAEDLTAIASGGRDGITVRFLDPRTGKPAGEPVTDHSGPVNAITVARLADRIFFVTGGRGRMIRLWDAATGAPAPLSLAVSSRGVNAVAAIPMPDDSTVIAAGGSDGTIALQEMFQSKAGAPATTPSTGHNGPVCTIAVTRLREKTVFVSGSRDGTVRLWDPLSGAPVGAPAASHLDPLSAVAVVPLPDGRNLIATSETDGTVQLWDPAADPPSPRALEHYAQVYAMAAVELPRRTLLAIGGGDGTVQLWDPGPSSGELVRELHGGHAGQRVTAIASVRRPNGETVLVTGGSDGTVQFWDPATGAATGVPLTGHVGRIRAVAPVFLLDGRTLLAAGGDYGVVQIWEGTERRRLIGPPPGQRTAVHAIAAVKLPDRTLLATGSDDGMVRLWDPLTGDPAGDAWVGHSGPVRTLAAVRQPGGPALLASGGDDKTILIWTLG